MKDLIEALMIFQKYKDLKNPTNCSHDQLWIVGIEEDEVSDADAARLEQLGFLWAEGDCCWISFRFGSA